MRALGIDVGDSRIGFALSDPTGLLASPLGVYRRRRLSDDVAHVVDLVHEYDVERVIVGLPRNMNGSEGPQAEKTREFALALADNGLDIAMWDERLTTVQATRILEGRRVKRRRIQEQVDALAAALILDSYLRSLPRLSPVDLSS